MDEWRTERSEVIEKDRKHVCGDRTYYQFDLHFINEASDALDNTVSSVILKTHVIQFVIKHGRFLSAPALTHLDTAVQNPIQEVQQVALCLHSTRW